MNKPGKQGSDRWHSCNNTGSKPGNQSLMQVVTLEEQETDRWPSYYNTVDLSQVTGV